jgi:hypothetical protein
MHPGQSATMLVSFSEKVLNANMNKYKDFITGSDYKVS